MIESTNNAQVKHLVRLNEKAKYRRACGLFLTEGLRMAREVPPERLEAIYISQHFAAEHPQEASDLIKKAIDAGACYERMTDAVFAKASGTVTPQGVLCVVRQKAVRPEELFGAKRPLHLLLLEGVQDPGNLGTMLRTGEGAGLTGIIADEGTADLYNPKTVRATMGSIFRVPFVRVKDAAACVRLLNERGIATAAMRPDAEAEFTDADFTGDIAFLIGNEGRGLSPQVSDAASMRIRIPMEGSLESLNAAVSAALCMYEARRQRGLKHYASDGNTAG